MTIHVQLAAAKTDTVEIDLDVLIAGRPDYAFHLIREPDGRYKDREDWRDTPFFLTPTEVVHESTTRIRFPKAYVWSVSKDTPLRLEIPACGFVKRFAWPTESADRAPPEAQVDPESILLQEMSRLDGAAVDDPQLAPDSAITPAPDVPPPIRRANRRGPRTLALLLVGICVLAAAIGYAFWDDLKQELQTIRDDTIAAKRGVDQERIRIESQKGRLSADQAKLASERAEFEKQRRQGIDRIESDRQALQAERKKLADDRSDVDRSQQAIKRGNDELDAQRLRLAEEQKQLGEAKRQLERDQEALRKEQWNFALTKSSPPPVAPPTQTADPPSSSPLTTCDQLAANPADLRKAEGVYGVSYPQLRDNARAAIEACEQAAKLYPSVPRYRYQLARALQATDWNKALPLHEKLVREGYPAAFDNLGWLHIDKLKNISRAARLFRQGAERDDPDSMVSLAELILKNHVRSTSDDEVMQLYRRAAELGHRGAAETVQKAEAAALNRQLIGQFAVEILKGVLGLTQ